MKIVVTGGGGLLGWHAAARIHARNAAARFQEEMPPFELVVLDRTGFSDSARLHEAVREADGVLHLAGVNRAPDEELERANPAIAQALVDACRDVAARPHIVYANSVHASSSTPYGRSKLRAGEILAAGSNRFTDLVLPHIFGEGARPNYNNVTATFIDAVIRGKNPEVNPDGVVRLLHAGEAVEAAITAVTGEVIGRVEPEARSMHVPDLLERIQAFHTAWEKNIFPDLSDPFELALFNSYRTALYPDGFPRPLHVNVDTRGTLFEAVKGEGGGQTFLSWTEPGITRGNHFHLRKIERFLVLEGEAVIRMRPVLRDDIWEYRVSGDVPAVVDMPTLHTHSIENIGDRPLLTLFWSHELFDPDNPDTYADPVLDARKES